MNNLKELEKQFEFKEDNKQKEANGSSKYINVEQFICSLDGSECLDTERDYEEIERRLEEFESADIQEIRHGKWSRQGFIIDEYGDRHLGYVCSVCKKFVPNKGNYCLECGAKMDGKE